MSDAALTECPECGKACLSKQISAAGFRLKGGGWYETDFKSSGNKKNLAGDTAGAAKSDTSGSAKAAGGSSTSSAD